MPGEPDTQGELMEDLVCRLSDRREGVREAAAEALALAAGEEGWWPDELVLCDGIGPLVALLGERNPRIVRSALSVIRAIAAAGHGEELLTRGVMDGLEELKGHRDEGIREMAREALWLLTPGAGEEVPEPLEED